MEKDPEGHQKSALVTGASSGIGFATSIELAKRGYKVFAGARRLEPMEPLEKYGVITIELDVTSVKSIEAAKEIVRSHTDGYLDILYNNAGQSCTFPCLDVTDDYFRQCYEVNVFGGMRMVREFAPFLINSKGVIAFTGSVTGMVPFPFSSVYASSKAAIHQYAAVLRIEMKPFEVKVLNIVTGGVETNIEDKRGLPASSIYNTPSIEEALVERRQMARRNKPLSPELYAYRVVNDFEACQLNGALNVYRGRMATILGRFAFWIPRRIIETILTRKFKLVEVFDYLQKKYSKTKID